MNGTEKIAALLAAQKKARVKQIEAAKAAAPDKEPFSLDILEQYLDVRGLLGGTPDRALISAELEREYYLRFTSVRTLEDFAQQRQQAATWS